MRWSGWSRRWLIVGVDEMSSTNYLNMDQKKHFESLANAVAETLCHATVTLSLINAMHESSKEYPSVPDNYPWMLEKIWRISFDHFFVQLGTALDNTKNTASLHGLYIAAERYAIGNPELLSSVKSARNKSELATNTLFTKVKEWRHSVAHKTQNLDKDAFYQANKMSLKDCEILLSNLYASLNELTPSFISVYYVAEEDLSKISHECRVLFAKLDQP